MATKTITLTDEDTRLLQNLLSHALEDDQYLTTSDEPGARALLSDLQAPEDTHAAQPSLLDPVSDTLFTNRLFTEADVTGRHTREGAIAEGALVDVSTESAEAGFLCPVAVTAALMADIKDVPESKRGIQDKDSRLWDVLYVGEIAGKIVQTENERHLSICRPSINTYVYQITMPLGRRKKYDVKLSLGFGDHNEPVATLMKPDES